MIDLDPDELLEALEAHGRRAGLSVRRDRGSMIEALAEAGSLAAGRPENEPAALLCSFGRRLSQLGPAARLFLRSLVRARAVANGFELEMSDLELAMHCAGIARGEIDFLELRGWCAARLRPLRQQSRHGPPKRQR
jgi:hypothetical protein